MKLIKEKFTSLFSKCFNLDENQTFLNHIQVNLKQELIIEILKF